MISVIIPVYNVEKYLDTCIKSVLAQTYANFEMLLIDDGSTDDSGKICDKWAKSDSRIIVIHKKNGGLSDARNKGLDIAKGDYLFFLDSDDWIVDNAFELLKKNITKTNADMTLFYMCQFLNESTPLAKQEKEILPGIYTKKTMLSHFKKNIPILVTACSKLYKKALFDDIRFEHGKINEDDLSVHKIIDKCTLISAIEDVLYCYRKTPGSIMHSIDNIQATHVLKAYIERVKLLEKYTLTDAVNTQLYNFYNVFKYQYPRLAIGTNEEKIVARDIYKDFLNLTCKIKKIPQMKNAREKIGFNLILKMPKVYVLLFTIYTQGKRE